MPSFIVCMEPNPTLLGHMTDDEAVVMQCARSLRSICAPEIQQMASNKKSTNDQPIVFGIKNGNECWMAVDTATAKRGGEALQQCDSHPDRRGQAVGGMNALSVYTMHPAGVLAQYIRIIRKSASLDVQPEPQTAFLHIAGLSVDDGDVNGVGRPWNMHDVAHSVGFIVTSFHPKQSPAHSPHRNTVERGTGRCYNGSVSSETP